MGSFRLWHNSQLRDRCRSSCLVDQDSASQGSNSVKICRVSTSLPDADSRPIPISVQILATADDRLQELNE